MCGGLSAYKKCLKMLGSIDAELKLVIAGNHDLSLDGPYWQANLEEDDNPEEHSHAMEIMTGPLAKQAGVTYLEEGTHSFILQYGAKFTIYVSPYQPEFGEWAFPYKRDQDRFNTPSQAAPNIRSIAQNPIPDLPGVDIVMTHGPPRRTLDQCTQGNIGCDSLLRAVTRAKPLMHCFGHIHEGYGAKLVKWSGEPGGVSDEASTYPEARSWPILRGEETLMVNAALMDGKNQPANAPWIIDLDLPSTS